ncbi:hypothetical protein [Streptomyces parvulus]|uniref:hypothetical protein n=1 Tax=Streptomyces parvulus TaxID=146923 RepID=UPI00341F5DF6
MAALEDVARNGQLATLAEQSGWPAPQFFAMEVERIEWENGMRHREIVENAGGSGSGADLFSAEGDFDSFYERQVRDGHTHSYEFRYSLLREEAASAERRRRAEREDRSSRRRRRRD